MPESNPPALRVLALGHHYGGQPCLDDVTLQVDPGELVTVLGRSGCGKSTLLRAIAGFVTPQRGSIDIAGVEVVADGVERTPAERRGIGLVFQEYALFPHMTVRQNVAFGVEGRPDRGAARAAEVLALVGLSDLADRRPFQLSGGQQQRVAIARALAPGPQLLLLDEPFANLDAALRHGLRSELRRVLADVGAAALLVTHNREEALSVADRLVVLGRPETHAADAAGATVLRSGPPRDVYDDPQSRTVALLTGEASFVPSLDDPQRSVALRPHDAAFDEEADGACTIRDAQFIGGRTLLVVETPDGQIIVESTGTKPAPRPGHRGGIRRLQPGAPLQDQRR